MVRSIWRRTVLGVLASTGLAWGQQAVVPPAPATDTVGRIITVTEMGKSGQKCRVMREWKTADGSIARQVVDLNSGEKMTIVETGVLSGPIPGQPGGNIKSIASRIYHWGLSETSPAGVPMPPETEAPAMAAKTPTPEKKKREAGPALVQNTSQTPAPASPYAPTRSAASDDKNAIILPAPAMQPVIQNPEPVKPAYTVPRPIWTQASTTATVTTSPPVVVTQTPAQPAQPSDWRKSWGKLPERAKADETAKKSDDAFAAKKDTTTKPKTDPLGDPLPYSRVGVEEKINERMKIPKHAEEKPPNVAKTTPDVLPPLPPLPPLERPEPPMPTVKQEEPRATAPVVTLPSPADTLPAPVATPPARVATPPAPVVTLPAPVITPPPVAAPPAPAIARPNLRHEKVASPVMPAPEPVGRVVIHNEVDAGMVASQTNTQHLLHVLRESIYPSQREWAADQLAECDWKQNGPVVDAMITAAKEDPAATVRAGCVRCLGHMHANTVPVVLAVQSLKSDSDPRVRTEVQEALTTLAPGLSMPAEPTPEPVKGDGALP